MFTVSFSHKADACFSAATIIFAILGLAVSHYFFAFHLMDIVLRINVLQAVTTNAYSLLLTLLFGFLIIYYFSIVGYATFSDKVCVHLLHASLRLMALLFHS